MPDAQTTFVNTSGLARALFMDHRTLRSRIESLGIRPDAQFLEGTGLTMLFSVERIPRIREQVGGLVADDLVVIHGVDVGITSPLFPNSK